MLSEPKEKIKGGRANPATAVTPFSAAAFPPIKKVAERGKTVCEGGNASAVSLQTTVSSPDQETEVEASQRTTIGSNEGTGRPFKMINAFRTSTQSQCNVRRVDWVFHQSYKALNGRSLTH